MKQLLILAALFPLSVSAEEQRSLSSHEHGSGTLGIAISGSEIALALDAPGADIVGFEHEATTAEDRAAVETAVSDLARPLGLFVLPDSAGCTVTEASVSLVGEEHEEEAHEDGHEEHHEEYEEHEEHNEAGHTEFRAEYVLTCQNPEAIERIEFAYFERFENARELDVQLVTDKGAKAYEVERDAPVLDLRGMF